MHRLSYAFSKHPACHAAAVALDYVAYNLCHVVRTLRVTPALQAQVTDHCWTLAELLDALMSEPMPEAIQAKPLAHRAPEAPHRALPKGGFLRLVTEPTPARKHAPGVPDAPPPAAPGAAPPIAPAPSRQTNFFDLDAFAAFARPKDPEGSDS